MHSQSTSVFLFILHLSKILQEVVFDLALLEGTRNLKLLRYLADLC